MTEFVLEIPRAPASPNEFLGHHWRHRKRNADLWQKEIHVALCEAGQYPRPAHAAYARARIVIERRSRGQLDPDNLVGSVKPILDALRYLHVIENDTPDHVELVVTQLRSHGLPARTRIEIHPLEIPCPSPSL